ncbi:MAG: NAD(P)-binding protein [Rhodocyclaceae bacterium]|nr:NAD(P)-binding protein [Rhodocyclaceae bacterium]
MRRRDFLAVAASLPLIACTKKSAPPLPPGTLSGGDFALGHRLRAGDFPAPSETRRVPLLIVGAGIAGLSAAWRLERAGLRDFLIYELEEAPGGNARFAENEVSAYPLGAHYLPLPTREARALRELLADLGALEGDPQAARPHYDERLLCAAPQERVYRQGFWEEGLLPRLGVSRAVREEYARFFDLMQALREARDEAGRRAFALPLAFSSPAPRWRSLDGITMRQWLFDHGLTSPELYWYVDYCCRDDFGTRAAETSAWAGLHYFACRNGEAANAAPETVLTAPEGNGWIVKRLAPRFADRLVTGALAFRLAQTRRRASADFWLAAEGRSLRIEAEAIVWAAPPFMLPKVAAGLPAPIAAACRAETAPWLVANLTLSAPPAAGAGAGLAWDNVLYGSPALGYVVATHQHLSAAPGPTVLTYYHALAEMPPAAARELLLRRSQPEWAALILAELSRAHADIGRLTKRLDIHRHGHAMVRPVPGLLWGGSRAMLAAGWGRVFFAHADVSGLSLCEEANYRGVLAAERALALLGQRAVSLL